MELSEGDLEGTEALRFEFLQDDLVGTSWTIDVEFSHPEDGHSFSDVKFATFPTRAPDHGTDLTCGVFDRQVHMPGTGLGDVADFPCDPEA